MAVCIIVVDSCSTTKLQNGRKRTVPCEVGGWMGWLGLYASDDLCPLGLELCGVALVRLLFALDI